MRRKTLRVGILWRLIIALILAPCLGLVGSNPVAALNLEDYFSLISTVELSKTQVTGNELFNAMVEATGSVTSDLPVLPSEAEITSRIIATHQANGANVTLNSGYTVTIDPFPIKTGDARQVQLVVPLQFPQGRQSGTDSVVAELIGAIVTVLGIPLPITDFVPPSSLPPPQTVGSVTYVPPPPLPPPPPGGGGGGDGGGGGVPTAEVSISGLSSTTTLNVDEDGMLQETSQLETLDKKVSVAVAQGTKLLDAQGEALGSFSATAVTSSPEPPSQRAIVYAYDFGPDGATFDPPISLTITYDESLIPENVVEENLSMAIWDEAISKWVVLDGSTVDPENNTITAPVRPMRVALAMPRKTNPI